MARKDKLIKSILHSKGQEDEVLQQRWFPTLHVSIYKFHLSTTAHKAIMEFIGMLSIH